MSKSGATLRDVAKHAGVSHQTVSRVVNGNARVSPATRAKVEASIAALQYRPNLIARQVAQGGRRHMQSIVCYTSRLSHPYVADMVAHIQLEVERHGYALQLRVVRDAAAIAPPSEASGIVVAEPAMAAPAMAAPAIDQAWLAQLDAAVPIVMAGGRPRDVGGRFKCHSVSYDDVAAGYVATKHLLGRGHTKIGMLAADCVDTPTRDMSAGFEAALAEAQIVPVSDWSRRCDGTAQGAFEQTTKLVASAERPSAIFVQGDEMTAGVMRAAHVNGVSVPEQLSVISVDDLPLATCLMTPLTTLRRDGSLIGKRAADLLIDAIANPGRPKQHISITAALIERQSVSEYAAPSE